MTQHLHHRFTARVLLVFTLLCVPLLAPMDVRAQADAASESPTGSELLELRYTDGVSKPVQAQWVRLASNSECGQLSHLLRTDEGEEICGSYLPQRMEFRTAAAALGKSQHFGETGFDGYALPSPRTALLGYEVLSTPEGMKLNYSAVANQAPGFQVVASREGSVAQAHAVFYTLGSETRGSQTGLTLRQWKLGQMVMDSGPLAAAQGVGLEWRKSDSLRQNNVQVFNGRLLNEADLTVLVNQEARGTVPARPGDVSVYNVPLFEGNNEVTVIYRNEKGELVQSSRQVFFSQSLLPQGKWLGSAGVYQDKRLQHWAAQAQAEWGAHERLTAQAGLRANLNPGQSVPMRMANGELIKVRALELAASVRSYVGGGFLSAGLQSATAYGPGVQRLAYSRGSALVYLERANELSRLGSSFEPYRFVQGSESSPLAFLQGVRLGFAKALQGPEHEWSVSKSFRLENMPGAFVSAYCKVGVDSRGEDSNFCGLNANMNLGVSPFASSAGPEPVMGGMSYSKTEAGNSINGYLQTRDSFLLASKDLQFIRSRHDFQHVSVQGQYDNQGNTLAGVSGMVAVDYGGKPQIMGFLPNDPLRASQVLIAMNELTPARDLGFDAVQTRINGVLSTSGLNSGAQVGQINTILVNPESVSMDSELPALRLKLSPALPGIYKVGAKP